MACYIQSDIVLLKSIFHQTDIVELENSIKPTNVIIDSSDSSAILQGEFSVREIAPFKKEVVMFREPAQPSFAYKICADNICNLPMKKYNVVEREKAIKWLIDKLENTESYFILESCLDRLILLEKLSEEHVQEICKIFVTNMLGNKPSMGGSKAKTMFLDVLIALDARIDFLRLSDEEFPCLLDGMLWKLSDSLITWLAKQDFLKNQVVTLLENICEKSIFYLKEFMSLLLRYHEDNVLSIFQGICEHGHPSPIYFLALYVLHSKGELNSNIYIKEVLSIGYDDAGFETFAELVEYTGQLLKSELGAKYTVFWIDKVYDFSSRSIKEHSHKNQIASFMIELARLKIQKEKMEVLLKDFLSRGSDCNYWDQDAVSPCLPYLIDYFGESYKNYLIYKTVGAKFTRHLSNLIDLRAVDKIDSKDAKLQLIDACLIIYRIKHLYGSNQKKYDNDDNPALYVMNFDPELIILSVLKNIDKGSCEFLRDFVKFNKHAFLIDKDKFKIYSPSSVYERDLSPEIAEEMRDILRGECLLLEKGVVSIDSSLVSSSNYLIQYPDALLNRGKKRLHVLVDNPMSNEEQKRRRVQDEGSVIELNGRDDNARDQSAYYH